MFKYKLKNIWLHYWGTTIHKAWVFWFILAHCARMMYRAVVHDYTKYGMTESRGFFTAISDLRTTTYGTPEYKALLDTIKPSLDHHYSKWSHHPEHFEGGYADMNFEDLVEMFCDWKAAVRRHNDGDILRSIRVNKDRFGLSPDVVKIMENSAKVKEIAT